jgi:hypothetical protein
MNLRKHVYSVTAVVITFSLAFFVSIRMVASAKERSAGMVASSAAAQRDDAAAVRAFESIVPVLHHPRCMNCHSHGDFPRQGDDRHPHTMNVRRGSDGNGIAAAKCSSCHQDHNLEGLRVPPGAPGWHLPSPAMPVIWEGLTDRQLCEMFKDPKQNGHRNVDEIVEHMNTPLVLWGWDPGEGRTPVPTSKADFLESIKEWARNGAACPGDTKAR